MTIAGKGRGVEFVLVLLICSLCIWGRGAAQTNAIQSHTTNGELFKIAGTVVNAVTGAPIDGARVALVDNKKGTNVAQVWSVVNGHFEFTDLPAEKIGLLGGKLGYLTSAYNEHEGYSTAIVTGPGFATDHLLFRLTPVAVISGHVIDEAGVPVRHAQVVLFRENHSSGFTRVSALSVSKTDDRGYYDFSQLSPGTYFAVVSAKPWYAVHQTSAPNAPPDPSSSGNAALDVAYPATYYAGATDAAEATSLVLNAGEHLEADVHLIPVPSLHLILHAPADHPYQVPRPVLGKRVFEFLELVKTEQPKLVAPGVFEVSGVPAGHYSVAMTNPVSGLFEQALDVDLNHDGQEVTTNAGEALAILEFKVKMLTEETVPKQMSIVLLDERRRVQRVQRTDANGELKMWAVRPAKYSVMVSSPSGQFAVVQTSTSDGTAAGHDINVPPGVNLEVTASVVAGKVNVEGVVHKDGRPVPGVMVLLVPEQPEAHPEGFRRDQSDFDGTFVLKDAVPGTYTVVAIDDAWGFDWMKPGLLARYVQHGQNLVVGKLPQGSIHLPEAIEVQAR